jgi:hypothetical protein
MVAIQPARPPFAKLEKFTVLPRVAPRPAEIATEPNELAALAFPGAADFPRDS